MAKIKTQKGFTLTELIAVIAIIAVLSAILIPLMIRYIKKSKLRVANSNAVSIYKELTYCSAELKIQDNEDKINSCDKVYAVSDLDEDDPLQNDIKETFENNGIKSGYVYWEVDSDKNISFAQWSQNETTSIVGQYPNPSEDLYSSYKIGKEIK